MSVTAVSPLLLQRYELKYLIPLEMVEPISKFLEPFCVMDYYSQKAHDHFYMINSLYFDTPLFYFLDSKQRGIEPSYSLRVRAYGSDPKPPFYSEIKMKKSDFSHKMRGTLPEENWSQILQSGEIPDSVQGSSRAYLQKFIHMLDTYNASPKILTQYRRKAYLSEIDNYARVTFDRDLRYQYEEEFNLIPDESKICHYDHEDYFYHPERNVILELKAEKKIPYWMIQLIKVFDLQRTSFSKYCSAVLETRSPLLVASDFIPVHK